MKTLRTGDSADAIVDLLLRQRAAVYVPVVAAPAQRPRPNPAIAEVARRPKSRALAAVVPVP